MTESALNERVVVIGDLHLPPGQPASHGQGTASSRETALRNLVTAIADEDDDDARRHLVLLGDVIDFDLVRHMVSGRPVVAAIDRLEATHAPFVDSLRVAGGAGFRVHIVAGNHDPEWTVRDVADGLHRLLPGEVSVDVHPWILRMSNRIHAEHGNHYHDLSAMPRPSQPLAPDAPGLHVGSVIDRWHSEVSRVTATHATSPFAAPARMMRLLGISLRTGWRAVGRLITLTNHSERRRRMTYRNRDLAKYAREIGLRADAAAELDRLGQLDALAMVRRLMATLRHRGSDTRGQALMRHGARRVSEVLEQFEIETTIVLLAHSHVAEVMRLPGGGGYANPGRWAPDLDGAYPYLDIRWDSRVLSAELIAWDDAMRRSRSISVERFELSTGARVRPPHGSNPSGVGPEHDP